MKTFTKVYAGLLLIMVLCGAIVLLIPVFDPPVGGYSELHIAKLADKPTDYFAVKNPEPALLEVISSGKGVVYSFDDTQIVDLISQHGTNNFEYQNNYYQVSILFVDTVGYSYDVSILQWASIYVFMVALILLVSVVFVKRGWDSKKRREQPSSS